MFHSAQPRRMFWYDGFGRAIVAVGPTVWFLSATSFLTDVSSEMVVSILPAFVVGHLGLSPLAFGAIDGAYHGVAALMRLAGGVVADRWHRYKETAALGYAISAACRLAMLAVSSVGAILGIVVIERLGKGLRTAPRDALISLSAEPHSMTMAFGVHRTLDTAGAALGPVIAALVLAAAPRAFDAVFVVSFAVALVGLAILVLFVRNPERDVTTTATLRSSGLWTSPLFPRVVGAAGLLSLVTIGDGFVYLLYQQQLGIGAPAVPLMFTATALVYFALAMPCAAAADRVGRRTVWLAGHALLACVYVLPLLAGTSTITLGVSLLLMGAYYAATDGVLAALVSAIVPPTSRGAGLGLAATVTGVCRMASGLAVGAAWTSWGAVPIFAVMSGAILGAVVVALWLLRDAQERA